MTGLHHALHTLQISNCLVFYTLAFKPPLEHPDMPGRGLGCFTCYNSVLPL